jgi:hypothetical protein
VYLKVSPEGEGFIPSHRETVRGLISKPERREASQDKTSLQSD